LADPRRGGAAPARAQRLSVCPGALRAAPGGRMEAEAQPEGRLMQTAVPDNQTHALFPGSLADMNPQDLVSMVNAESTAEVPFGAGVLRGATSADEMLVLAGASATALWGILTSQNLVPDAQIGATGVKPKMMGRVLRRGRIWV